MRHIVLMRGAPGAGKSYFLRTNGLEQYALCADEIRMLFQSPVLGTDGKYQISQKNDKRVWKLLFDLLEERMARGEFTIVDATHAKTEAINQYKKLCQKYRYRCTVVDFTDVPMDVALFQNDQRPEHKRVPPHVIETQYERFKTNNSPGWVDVIKPNEFHEKFTYKPTDFSNYEAVVVIGDLQSCYTVLETYLGGKELNPNWVYVFCGDVLDRGSEHAEVLKFMMGIAHLPNVRIVWGNHEDHLDAYANDEEIKSGEFKYNTMPALKEAGIAKKDIREFVRKIGQICFFTFDDKAVIVTHGGISTLPDNLLFVATQQFIKGVGRYEDNIDQLFTDNTKDLVLGKDGVIYHKDQVDNLDSYYTLYQAHGHRNIKALPVQAAERSFNLEGKVEFGGHLRVAKLDKNGWETFEVENPIKPTKKLKPAETPSGTFLTRLRSSKTINERTFGNISSFNFSKNTFWDKKWDEDNVLARGLFVNTVTEEIVARSYNKFFNVGEVETTKLENLQLTLQFPVKVYTKPNGYLGITGYDSESDKLIIASKSSLEGPFQKWFEDLLLDGLGSNIDEYKQLLDERKLSGIFEVIDPVNDPHIVEYKSTELILLDLVNRSEIYSKLPWSETRVIANRFGFACKERVEVINNWQDFYDWYMATMKEDITNQEGYVIEDASGFMTKIKLPWYSMWKKFRTIKDVLSRKGNNQVKGGLVTTPEENRILNWMKSLPKDDLQTDIISLRKRYYRENSLGGA